MTPNTKIDLNHSKISRMNGLDDLARVLFPGNRNQQRVFLAIFVELKWAPDQFLSNLEPVADRHGISHRTLETVRAKMRRLGLIDHVSRFNKRHGYREGWVFSSRFQKSLVHTARTIELLRIPAGLNQRQKDQDVHLYL